MAFRFPDESPGYRAARDRLLEKELQLRRQMEAVAAELRALPPGGVVPEDYVFARMSASGAVERVRLSELFGDRDTLMVYHWMFPRHSQDTRPGPPAGPMSGVPLPDGPCPSCTALIDTWDGALPHFAALGGNLVVVARAPIEQVDAFARDRGWKNVALLSAAGTRFRADYGGDDASGEPVPIMTVFARDGAGAIRLQWASELVFAETDPGQDMRHLGTVEPLWTLFDLTPGGRPAVDEQLDYRCCHGDTP